MPNAANIQQKLASLRKKFASTLGQRIDQIKVDLNSLDSHPDPVDSMQNIFRQIHTLSGSAGTFGFTRVSEQSRQLELILKEYINNDTLPDAKTTNFLDTDLQKIHGLIARGPDDQASDEVSDTQLPVRENQDKLIYVLESEQAQGQALCLELQRRDFKTRLFSTIEEVIATIEHEKPDAMILEIVLSQEQLAATYPANTTLCSLLEQTPCVFLSSHSDWDSRLAAVRANGAAYLTKPLDISKLVDQLDGLTQRKPPEPYRVLVMDDALELAQHYSLILRQAGMYAETLTEPANILQKLESFKPELILLDFYFPGITGLEIAQVLRQHPVYFALPIIFLSTETDRDIQLKTLQQGDNFLEKPILNHHLVSAVKSRIERSRVLLARINVTTV